jgi:hypothetical protein
MVFSFCVQVIPKIPLKLGKAHYALATAHAALGTIAEIAALYILLAAGTNVLPPITNERFQDMDAQRADALVARAFVGIGAICPLIPPTPLVEAALVNSMRTGKPTAACYRSRQLILIFLRPRFHASGRNKMISASRMIRRFVLSAPATAADFTLTTNRNS